VCNATCGGGISKRVRVCVGSRGLANCSGSRDQYQPCSTEVYFWHVKIFARAAELLFVECWMFNYFSCQILHFRTLPIRLDKYFIY